MTDQPEAAKPINDGGAAFPMLGSVAHNSGWMIDYGMSKREHYAAQAMAGILAGYWANPDPDGGGMGPRDIAQQAVFCADALIAALTPS